MIRSAVMSGWDAITGGLIESKETYRFRSQPVEIIHSEVFRRLLPSSEFG